MFIMRDWQYCSCIDNTDFIASIYSVVDKLFFAYSYDGKGVPVASYESVEEAREVVRRIYRELRAGSSSYDLPHAGFLAMERLLDTDLTEFSGLPNGEGLLDYIIDHMRVKLGYKTLRDVVESYDARGAFGMPGEYNHRLRKFLEGFSLRLMSDCGSVPEADE